MTDHLGTVRDAVDSTGVVVNHIKYDSFGNVVEESNPNVNFAFGFTGREFEAEIGLQYNRARWYDPRVGRWVSEDPIGFGAGDTNLARYVGNGALTGTDPSGLEEKATPGKGMWEHDCRTGRKVWRPAPPTPCPPPSKSEIAGWIKINKPLARPPAPPSSCGGCLAGAISIGPLHGSHEERVMLDEQEWKSRLARGESFLWILCTRTVRQGGHFDRAMEIGACFTPVGGCRQAPASRSRRVRSKGHEVPST
jgi:RHS repeat-associated protein